MFEYQTIAGVGFFDKYRRLETQNFVWKQTYCGCWHSSMQTQPEEHFVMFCGQYRGGAASGQGSTQTG